MIAWLKKIAIDAGQAWDRFWFHSQSDAQLTVLAALRLCFCGVMFFFYLTRAFDVEFFYGAQGILPTSHLQQLFYFKFHPTFLNDGFSLWQLHALHTIFLLFLLSQTLGFCTRFAAIGTYVLHLAFLNRNPTPMFGVDMIGSFFLLYLCFADSNARYSVDAWLGRGAKKQSLRSHIAWRLMQVQLCVVYAFSGLEKCKGTRWWDGSALWDVLTMGNLQRWDLSFVAHAPILLALSVYVVLAWEIYFPVLIWTRFRLPMLAFGVIMHIGIFLFLSLPTFGLMMIALYLAFLNKDEIENGLARVVALVNRKSISNRS